MTGRLCCKTFRRLQIIKWYRAVLSRKWPLNFWNGRNTVGSVWARAKKSLKAGSTAMDILSRRHQHGWKKSNRNTELNQFASLPLFHRGTFFIAAEASSKCKTSLQRLVKKGRVCSHSNSAKPSLREAYQAAGFKFCAQYLDMQRIRLVHLMYVIHVDENSLYTNKNCCKLYIGKLEKDPYRRVKSKRFSIKIMFLAAVARPRWYHAQELLFQWTAMDMMVCRDFSFRSDSAEIAQLVHQSPTRLNWWTVLAVKRFSLKSAAGYTGVMDTLDS